MVSAAKNNERTIANLTVILARCRMSLLNWMPGTLVAIGLNSPRMFGGGFGLESEVSR